MQTDSLVLKQGFRCHFKYGSRARCVYWCWFSARVQLFIAFPVYRSFRFCLYVFLHWFNRTSWRTLQPKDLTQMRRASSSVMLQNCWKFPWMSKSYGDPGKVHLSRIYTCSVKLRALLIWAHNGRNRLRVRNSSHNCVDHTASSHARATTPLVKLTRWLTKIHETESRLWT